MGKVIPIIIMALCAFTSCSKNEEPTESATERQIKEIAAVLNGKFVGSEYSSTTNTTQHYEIIFIPYASPKIEEWMNGTISKKVKMYGECDVLEYYNDHLLETSSHWKYNIEIAYEGAQYKLNYYPDVYGRTETHTIALNGASSFIADGITFNKKQ